MVVGGAFASSYTLPGWVQYGTPAGSRIGLGTDPADGAVVERLYAADGSTVLFELRAGAVGGGVLSMAGGTVVADRVATAAAGQRVELNKADNALDLFTGNLIEDGPGRLRAAVTNIGRPGHTIASGSTILESPDFSGLPGGVGGRTMLRLAGQGGLVIPSASLTKDDGTPVPLFQGDLVWPPYRERITMGVDQAIPAGGNAILFLDTAGFDELGMSDGLGFVADADGWFFIFGQMIWASTVVPATNKLSLEVAGTERARVFGVGGAIHWIGSLTTGQTIRVRATNADTVARSVPGGTSGAYVFLALIRFGY